VMTGDPEERVMTGDPEERVRIDLEEMKNQRETSKINPEGKWKINPDGKLKIDPRGKVVKIDLRGKVVKIDPVVTMTTETPETIENREEIEEKLPVAMTAIMIARIETIEIMSIAPNQNMLRRDTSKEGRGNLSTGLVLQTSCQLTRVLT